MSWEGYAQNFCINGHFYTSRAGYMCDDPDLCEYCKAEPAVTILVDETNGDCAGLIPLAVLKTLISEPAETEICNLGCVHVISETIYRIPTKDEIKTLRHYYNDEGDLVPCGDIC